MSLFTIASSQTGMSGGDGVATLAAGCAVATFAFVMARGPSERWVHLALRNNADVATQSIGEEPNRRIVVLPRSG